MAKNLLTDNAVRQAKPAEKPYRKLDGEGLVLLIQPTGAKWWRFRYRFKGKAKMISLGAYPRVSLIEARNLRDEAVKKINEGIDPSDHRASERQAAAIEKTIETNTLEAIASEWYGRHAPTWATAHAKRVKERLDNHVIPYLGEKPITEITAPMVLTVLRRLEETGKLETAHKTKQSIGQIFRYAIATGRAETDPTPSLKGALPPAKTDHFPALLDPVAIGAVLRQFDGYGGYPPVRAGLRLGPLLFCRPGELRTMKWADLDMDRAEWRFTLSKTKTQQIVPLFLDSALCEGVEARTETPKVTQAFVPLVFSPGDTGQFDWSHETVVIRGIEQVVKVAHFRLSYSRKMFVLAYPRETQEMVMDAHIQTFAFFGGAPKRSSSISTGSTSAQDEDSIF